VLDGRKTEKKLPKNHVVLEEEEKQAPSKLHESACKRQGDQHEGLMTPLDKHSLDCSSDQED